MKVNFFSVINDDKEELEKFLQEKKVLDIKYNATPETQYSYFTHNVMIIYEED